MNPKRHLKLIFRKNGLFSVQKTDLNPFKQQLIMSEFIEEKIQLIAKEITEAEASTWTVTKIVKILNEMNTQSEKKLREKALELLKELDPNAAITYERFSKMRVCSSTEKSMPFNRGHIITSILKETSLPRSVAEKITLEVENQIKDTKINFLTTSLIRELVNAKLIMYGFEETRHNYARVGEPAYDVKKKLEEAPYSGEAVREYNILLELPKTGREMHFDGLINVEDLEGYSHRPYAVSFVAEKKLSLEQTILSAFKKANHERNKSFLMPSIYGLTFACAPFAKTKKDFEKAAELIKEACEVLDNPPLISLELFASTPLQDKAEHKINAARISNYLLEENTVVAVDSKYCLKLIDIKEKNFMILNNSGEEYYPMNKKIFSTTKGLDFFVDINLEKAAEQESEKDFFEELKKISEGITEMKTKKQELMKSRKYLKREEIETMKTGIGLTNIYSASEKYSQRPVEFAQKALKEINRIFDDCLFFGVQSKSALERFSESSGHEVHSQETLPFEECLREKKCCFTGKTASITELNELIEKKVKQIEFIGRL